MTPEDFETVKNMPYGTYDEAISRRAPNLALAIRTKALKGGGDPIAMDAWLRCLAGYKALGLPSPELALCS